VFQQLDIDEKSVVQKIFVKQPFFCKHFLKNSLFCATFFIYSRKNDKKFGLLGTLQTLGDVFRQSEWIGFADLQSLLK